MMTTQVDAVFDNGVFRPICSVSLADQQRVRLTIESEGADQTTIALSPEDWDAFCTALDAPPRNIPELRRLLQEPGVFDARFNSTNGPTPS